MLNWLENRIRFKSAIEQYLHERLPDRIGWPHVLGSALLALIAFQFVSGVLLSFVYSASPDGAYRSVRYINEEMRGGAWLRALHYWGASAVVIVAGLHLLRTFVFAAYRKPRELTWIAGMLLLLCILAFGQTGYLLPWDQKAYWGTAVTIRIVGTVPIIGPTLARLPAGGESVGALTLSRFYSIHVVLLPLITTLLVISHLILVRRFGITAPWARTREDPPRKTPFYPYQMARDAMGAFVALCVVMFLAWQIPAPLERPADPGDSTFVPRPDWYFLFLFQLLHYFEGKWEVVGTFVIPVLALLVFFALPFIDRGERRELKYRPVALLILIPTLGGWAVFTYQAAKETPRSSADHAPAGMILPRADRVKRPSEAGGLYLLKQSCFECHSMTQLGDKPDLQTLVRSRFPTGGTWFESHLKDHGRGQSNLDERHVEELMSALRLVSGDRPELLFTIPPKVRFGAHFYYNSSCGNCHRIDGQGGKKSEVPAPDLTLRLLRPKKWHKQHIYDAQSLVRKSKMPPFLHYEEHEYDALAEYILYLHTP